MGDHQYHCPPIDNSPSSSISDTPPLRESPRMNMLPISGTHSFRQLMDLVIQEMSSQIDSVSSGSSPGLVLYHHSNPNRSFIDLRVDEAIKQCEDEEAEPNEEQQLAIPKRAEKIGDAFKLTFICANGRNIGVEWSLAPEVEE